MAKQQMFRELKHSTFYVAFRIGIQGAEVTPFVADASISVTYSGRGAPNTLKFSLHNAFSAFILTKDNLGWTDPGVGPPAPPKWRGWDGTTVQPRYSEIPKRKIYDYKTVYNLKDSKGNYTYNFKPGTCIFNRNDPVRMFIHNPSKEIISPDGRTMPNEEWAPFFTGWIESYSIQTDYLTGESIIEITAHCIKTQLQRMRTSFTPIAKFKEGQIAEALYDTETAGFYRDNIFANSNTWTDQPLAHEPFLDAMQTLLLGDLSLPVDSQGNRSRVGFLEMGLEWRGQNPFNLTYWNYYRDPDSGLLQRDKTPITGTLEDWYTLLQFGEPGFLDAPVSIKGGAYSDNKFYTSDDVTYILGETTTQGIFSPWRARMHVLLPPKESEITQIIDEAVISIRECREWTTRYDLINDIVDRVDYQWITTPFGDVVFEIPMYDFSPDEYGIMWGDCFKVDKFVTSDTQEHEVGELYTGLIVSAGVETVVKTGAEQSVEMEGYFNRVFVKSDILAGKYGVNIDRYEAPIGGQAERGVMMQSLRVMALIEFQKRMAQFGTLSLEFAFHPYLLPNRNIQFGDGVIIPRANPNDISSKPNKIGYISSVTYDIKLFREITVSVDLSTIRDYVLDEKGIVRYNYIFGGARMPLSFKDIVGQSVESVLSGAQGITVAYYDGGTRTTVKTTTNESQEGALPANAPGDAVAEQKPNPSPKPVTVSGGSH